MCTNVVSDLFELEHVSSVHFNVLRQTIHAANIRLYCKFQTHGQFNLLKIIYISDISQLVINLNNNYFRALSKIKIVIYCLHPALFAFERQSTIYQMCL